MMRAQGFTRLGIDVGGTFTDLVSFTDGRVSVQKVPSSPPGFDKGVLQGIGEILRGQGIHGSDIGTIAHGTTVGTNAVLERRGAKTALLTTQGFRDVLEIGRLRTPAMYDLTWEKPPPLIERRHRYEVVERLDPKGNVVEALDEESVHRVAEVLKSEGMESLAICLLHSYANPNHEKRIEELLHMSMSGVHISTSSTVLPELREFERTSTTVVNAYIAPLMGGYLDNLQSGIDDLGIEGPLRVMQSNGGIAPASHAAAFPVFSIESGPAAGVVAASLLSRHMELNSLLTLDMGGTTAKASVIVDGEPSLSQEYEVGGPISIISRLIRGGGYTIRVPSIDIAEVGAGGGSIVWIDKQRVPRIGPESAGAVPGPACYKRGGNRPTVTDANVVLGYLNPSYLAGGELPINRDRSAKALMDHMANPLDLRLEDAAHGAHLLANAGMKRALRAVSTERGLDTRDFTLLAFGGSGPTHAAQLAKSLGIGKVIVPRHPGLFSALGLLAAEIRVHIVKSMLVTLEQLNLENMFSKFAQMEKEAAARLGAPVNGRNFSEVKSERLVDLRFQGQAHELTVRVPDGIGSENLRSIFRKQHETVYGYAPRDQPVELVSLRLRAKLEEKDSPTGSSLLGLLLTSPNESPSRKDHHVRDAYFGKQLGWIETPIISRNHLDKAEKSGPLIIEEYDSTTVIPPDCTASSDGHGNINIHIPVD